MDTNKFLKYLDYSKAILCIATIVLSGCLVYESIGLIRQIRQNEKTLERIVRQNKENNKKLESINSQLESAYRDLSPKKDN